MHKFAGIYTPLATPFAADGSLDARALARNVGKYLKSPLTGLVVLGSNGEAPQIDDDEADLAIKTVRDAMPKDRPLLAGTGRESTAATIAATKRAADLGVDAVLVRTPSFYKGQMTTDAFVRHYTAVADRSPVPVLLYNVTMYTGVNLLPMPSASSAAIRTSSASRKPTATWCSSASISPGRGDSRCSPDPAPPITGARARCAWSDPRRRRRRAEVVHGHFQRRPRRPLRRREGDAPRLAPLSKLVGAQTACPD
jgi:hypothetical protein